MKVVAILREAGLNLLTGTTRGVAFALALALGACVLAGADIATVAAIERQAEQFQTSGGSTLIYTMSGKINGAACDGLASVDGVRAAGAVRREPEAARAGTLPGHDIPTFSVSPAFGGFRALGNPEAGAGVMLSGDLAETLGVRAGDTVELVDGSPVVGSVYTYDDDGRRPGLGYAILLPAATTAPFDECWAETWPTSADLAGLLATTLEPGAFTLGSGGPTPELGQLNSRSGAGFDGATTFEGRVTRFAPEALALLGFALGFLSVRIRRLEFASALHARVPRSALTLQMLVETAGWTAIAALLSAPVVFTVAHALDGTDPLALTAVGQSALASAPATIVGALIAAVLIRERNLFAYFRDR